MIDEIYNYIPLLALSTAEMSALEQLPDKDKDILLPMFALRGWMSAKNLEKTMGRISQSIGERPWIADIDKDFVYKNAKFLSDPDSQRPVFKELAVLLDSTDGYRNWVDFVAEQQHVIPTLQTHDLEQVQLEIAALNALGRGIVVRFRVKHDSGEKINRIVRELMSQQCGGLLIILDFDDIGRNDVLQGEQYGDLVSKLSSLLPGALFSSSASSFPISFSGSYRGELPIYERQLHTKVCKLCPSVRIIYSDRGSARASRSNGGGGGLPPPRIDYPIKNDWRYVRKEFEDPDNVSVEERYELYKQAASEIMNSDYWIPSLRLWGVQMIEKTAVLRDDYCITSQNRATAARINIHLYQQLHYSDEIIELSTDEEWED